VAFISHRTGGHLSRLKKPGCLSRLNRYEIWRKRQECSRTGEGWEGLGRSGTKLAQHEQEGQRQISFGRTHLVRIARLGEVVQKGDPIDCVSVQCVVSPRSGASTLFASSLPCQRLPPGSDKFRSCQASDIKYMAFDEAEEASPSTSNNSIGIHFSKSWGI
jgi:hypothetical protein